MIEVNKILQTDVLDILFDGRNKEYGAYELRTNYQKRLVISVITTFGICALFLLLYSFANGSSDVRARDFVIPDTELDRVVEPDRPVEIPKPKPPEQVATIRNVVPVIAKDEDVKPEDVPPPVEDLQGDVKIGNVTQDGAAFDGVVAPPNTGNGTGVIDLPTKDEDDKDKVFVSVQIESEYPGGIGAWKRYLEKTLPRDYTEDYVERGLQGRVVVMFIVDKEGNVSDVQGIEGPKELWGIAEKVIRKSGKWKPAINNGATVTSYKRQPIIFQIPEE